MKENYNYICEQVDKKLQNSKNKTTYPIYYPPIEETVKQPKSKYYFCPNCGKKIEINFGAEN